MIWTFNYSISLGLGKLQIRWGQRWPGGLVAGSGKVAILLISQGTLGFWARIIQSFSIFLLLWMIKSLKFDRVKVERIIEL